MILVCVNVFITFHITAQSGPVINVCTFFLHSTAIIETGRYRIINSYVISFISLEMLLATPGSTPPLVSAEIAFVLQYFVRGEGEQSRP